MFIKEDSEKSQIIKLIKQSRTDTELKTMLIDLVNLLVVDNIDNALLIAKKYKYSLRIVTLEGEQLNPGGSMTGGAFKNSSNLLGRKRELDEIDILIEKLKTDLITLNDDNEKYD